MSGRRGLLVVILFIILSFFVSADDRSDCNNNGGIWCDNINVCVNKYQENNGECVILFNQNVDTKSMDEIKYAFNILIIKEGKTLYFGNSQAPSQKCTAGGNGGERSGDWGSYSARGHGGDGGYGGCLFEKGKDGYEGEAGINTGNDGGDGGFLGKYAGANVLLEVDYLEINGIISVSGSGGGSGTEGNLRCFGVGKTDAPGAGGGGAGGNGAGKINIDVRILNGSGLINAKGGSGGWGLDAGHSEDSNGCSVSPDDCDCDDWNTPECSGAGGGGGGGVGGVIIVNATGVNTHFSQFDDTSIYNNRGGAKGSFDGIVCHPGASGYKGSDGPLVNSDVQGENDFIVCNNGKDDDFDGLIDMQDSSCYNLSTKGGICPDNQGLIVNFESLSLDYAKSFNGSDGCCGDDGLICETVISSESIVVPQNMCDPSNCGLKCEERAVTNYCVALGYNGYVVDSMVCDGQNHYQGNWADNDDNPLTHNCGISGSDEWVISLNCSFPEIVCEFKPLIGYDYTYVSDNSRYFCSNDYDTTSKGIDSSVSASWHWWDAQGVNAFKIHETNVSNNFYDFISNGGEWFACDASGDADAMFGDLSSDNYVDEYKTFRPKVNKEGQVACSDTLQDLPGWEGTSDCNPDDNDGIACGVNPGYPYCKTDSEGNPLSHLLFFENFQYSCGQFCFNESGKPLKDWISSNQGVNTGESVFCFLFPDICENNLFTNNLNSGSYEIFKSECGKTLTCLGGLFRGSCNDLDGDFCKNDDEYCEGGVFVKSLDSEYKNFSCCYNPNGEASCKQLDDDLCVEKGGLLGDSSDFYCSGRTVNENCCFEGKWQPYLNAQDYFGTHFIPESKFICYDSFSGSTFAECCGDSASCKNIDSPLHGDAENLKYKYFGAGATFHTLNNYDVVFGHSVVDKAIVSNKVIDVNPFALYISQRDWSGFDYFVFDIGYNDPANIGEVILSDMQRNEEHYNILDYSKAANTAYRWHRVMIPLNLQQSTLNYSNIVWPKIKVSATLDMGGVDMIIDNIHLYSDDNAEGEKSLNYYCSGDWGSWIGNLDGESDVGFNRSSTVAESGPYHSACEAQGPFDWTGLRCCGDDSWPNTYGEFYNDTRHGCYNGTTVYNDWMLANATNDKSFYNNYLLFYEETFWICGDEAYNQHFKDVKQSFDGDISSISLPVNISTYFESRGSWYCDPSEGWVYIKDANKMKIIASTLQDMAKDDSSYILHCGETSTVMNFEESPYGVTDNYVPTDKFCVLKRGDGSIILGTSVPKKNMTAFLNQNLQSFHPFDDEHEVVYTCNFDNSVVFDNESFFRTCENVGDWLNASYNPYFGIVIFGLQESTHSEGFFGFFVNMWKGLTSFFKNLFSESIDDESTSMSIPINVNQSSLEELYIKNSSNKLIRGSRDKDVIVVEYIGFNDVSFLKGLTSQWFNQSKKDSDLFDVVLESINEISILKINGTDNVLINNFPWEFLTSNLKFN
ncbi:MAG: hypothetical protein KKF65_07560 [Nanoarchaeota archaeon]|nr:hypothetical protein [Nanoarchaeota archaeon]